MTRKETNYASHGYHKYPAKFIPQLVRRLLEEYSREGDIVLDTFGGCGTTLVESKLNGRSGICIDINEAALLMSSAKANSINPILLEKANKNLLDRVAKNTDTKNYYKNANARLKYWFGQRQFNKLNRIFNEIQKEQNWKLRTFYNCCFSNILKNCSIWYSKSIKPMRDPDKGEVEPINAFINHLKFMTTQNYEYYNLIKNSKTQRAKCYIKKADARKTGLPGNFIDLIITSPPYAISYEYADIHQLSLLWFGFVSDLSDAHKSYIGTASRGTTSQVHINSRTASEIIEKLKGKDSGLANHVTTYVVDLEASFREMYRVLRYGKNACIIMGDTEYKNIAIKNTKVSLELLKFVGFDIVDVIKRRISSKTFTPYRDKDGKFSDDKSGKKMSIYQYEYIIIAKKNLWKGIPYILSDFIKREKAHEKDNILNSLITNGNFYGGTPT